MLRLHVIERGRSAGIVWARAAPHRALNPHRCRRPGSRDRRYGCNRPDAATRISAAFNSPTSAWLSRLTMPGPLPILCCFPKKELPDEKNSRSNGWNYLRGSLLMCVRRSGRSLQRGYRSIRSRDPSIGRKPKRRIDRAAVRWRTTGTPAHTTVREASPIGPARKVRGNDGAGQIA
jgi:hypothetical protein